MSALRKSSLMRRIGLLLCCVLSALALATAGAQAAPSSNDIRQVASQYVTTFYPAWFYHSQLALTRPNRLIGPRQVTPIYHAIVAINVDTLYASAEVDLSKGPVILTVPRATSSYSLLNLDLYGDIFTTSVPSHGSAGDPSVTYQLVGPRWRGTRAIAGATLVRVPLTRSLWVFRADKHASTGEDTTAQAELFRRGVRIQPLVKYRLNPSGGATNIVSEAFFALPFKQAADGLLTYAPIPFLTQLRKAVHTRGWRPTTAGQRVLSVRFDRIFRQRSRARVRAALATGARTAHAALNDNYLNNTDVNNWISFTNIGHWGTNYLDRASITEYIQVGNGLPTAAYYHAFKDGTGVALDGSAHSYVLTFPADNLPQTTRFWSLTAYLPESIELVPNAARKYAVGSYTDGLVKGGDGSISIYLSPTLPAGVPETNWLPVPDGPFNVMLRNYGPTGGAQNGDYVPPAIATTS